MWQERESKRLDLWFWIGHYGIDYIECGDCIEVGIFLYLGSGRSFFLDRSKLAHRSAWEGATIGCCCTFSSHMSCNATIQAKVVIESSFAFLFGESAASSAAATETTATPLGRIYFCGDIFLDFIDTSVSGPEAPRGSAARDVIDVPSLVQFSGLLN